MRRWNNPQILITVNNELIELKMGLEDFQGAVTAEVLKTLSKELASTIGSVTWTFKQETFNTKAVSALEKVLQPAISNAIGEAINAIKGESIKVV